FPDRLIDRQGGGTEPELRAAALFEAGLAVAPLQPHVARQHLEALAEQRDRRDCRARWAPRLSVAFALSALLLAPLAAAAVLDPDFEVGASVAHLVKTLWRAVSPPRSPSPQPTAPVEKATIDLPAAPAFSAQPAL